MRKTLLIALAVVLAVNGIAMLGWPEPWYHFIPTVPSTGPFNAHFVRDIGCAYLVSGVGSLWFAYDPARGRSAALAGSAFLGLHALVHVWDVASGRMTLHHLAQDFAGVILPPIVLLWLILTDVRSRA